jgi:anaerobic glycerol-3-phosphate dehydrogenase
VPHPQQLRDNPDKRREVNIQTAGLLDSINAMLED